MKQPNLNTVVLKTKNLSIGYPMQRDESFYLQKNLNLELYTGNLVCVIGQNGCGKTTLIRTISGIQKALKGEILLHSEEINQIGYTQRSKLLSVVLTEKTVVDTMLVSEIVALGRYSHTNWLGSLNTYDFEKIEAALKQVGLQNFSDRMYGTLSDGEKQRAFIAKALASEAPVLILDEPTAHLDIPNRVEVISLLQKLTRENNQAILVSTHDLDLALQLADEIWLFDPESGISQGTPEEIIDSGKINALFGGENFEFLASTGTICLRRTNTGTVGIQGSGSKFDQLIRALNRIGLTTSEENNIPVKIEVSEQKYRLTLNKTNYDYLFLPELLRRVRTEFSATTGSELQVNGE